MAPFSFGRGGEVGFGFVGMYPFSVFHKVLETAFVIASIIVILEISSVKFVSGQQNFMGGGLFFG